MKNLSKLAFAAVLFLLLTSFEPVKRSAAASRDNTYYYWYIDGGSQYDGFRNTSDEIARLENEYGVYIDTDSLDGSLIASGFIVKGYLHLVYPSVNLNSHCFDY